MLAFYKLNWNEKKKYLDSFGGGIFILLIIINWRYINSFLADKSLSSLDKIVAKYETVYFRSSAIDSLYLKNNYKHFLFIKGEMKNNFMEVHELPCDSVLLLKPDNLSLIPVKKEFDTVSIPSSAVELMIPKGEIMTLYDIISIKRDSVGNYYKLKRIQNY